MKKASAHFSVQYRLWHTYLDMPTYTREWHQNDIQEEFDELKDAVSWRDRWSEYSDVVYTVTRARWSGFRDISSPLTNAQFMYGSLYMFPKYTLRYWFYRSAARKSGYTGKFTEIRNPQKVHKLREMAERYGIDADTFVHVCHRQLRYWPLLK